MNVAIVQAIFTAGYKAVLHIHAVVEECEIVELLQQIDPKTKKPMKRKVLFVKNGAIVVCRVQVGFVALLVINFIQHFLFENFETIINVENKSQIEIWQTSSTSLCKFHKC